MAGYILIDMEFPNPADREAFLAPLMNRHPMTEWKGIKLPGNAVLIQNDLGVQDIHDLKTSIYGVGLRSTDGREPSRFFLATVEQLYPMRFGL